MATHYTGVSIKKIGNPGVTIYKFLKIENKTDLVRTSIIILL